MFKQKNSRKSLKIAEMYVQGCQRAKVSNILGICNNRLKSKDFQTN